MMAAIISAPRAMYATGCHPGNRSSPSLAGNHAEHECTPVVATSKIQEDRELLEIMVLPTRQHRTTVDWRSASGQDSKSGTVPCVAQSLFSADPGISRTSARLDPTPDSRIIGSVHSNDGWSAVSHNSAGMSVSAMTVINGDVLQRRLKNAEGSNLVSFADSYLRDQGCETVCRFVEQQASVTELDLRGNDIHESGANAIAKLLRLNTTIRKLNVQWNFLGESHGLHAIMEALATNRTLIKLDLRNNKLDGKGARSVAGMLARNATLRQLDLRWNALGEEGGRAICQALQGNHVLHECQVTGNNVPMEICQGITDLLARNKAGRVPSSVRRPVESAISRPPGKPGLNEMFQFSQNKIDALKAENADFAQEITNLKAQLAMRQNLEQELHCQRVQFEAAERDWQTRTDMKSVELANLEQSHAEVNLKLQAALSELKDLTDRVETIKAESGRRERMDAEMRSALQKDNLELSAQIDRERSAALEFTQRLQASLDSETKRRALESEATAQRQQEEAERFAAELKTLKEDHQQQLSASAAKIKQLEADLDAKTSELAAVKQGTVQQTYELEEKYHQMERRLREDYQKEQDSKVVAMENRIVQLQISRDQLEARSAAHESDANRYREALDNEKIRAEHAIQMEQSSRMQLEGSAKAAASELKRKDAQIAELETQAVRLRDEGRQHRSQLESDLQISEASRRREVRDLTDRLSERDDQIEAIRTQLRKVENANRLLKEDRSRREMKVKTAMTGLRQALDYEVASFADDAEDDDNDNDKGIRRAGRRSRSANRHKSLCVVNKDAKPDPSSLSKTDLDGPGPAIKRDPVKTGRE